MSEAEHRLQFDNPGPGQLRVWLEPWAEQFDVPAGSSISLTSSDDARKQGAGEVEWAEGRVIVWATASRIEVRIDGILQESASARIVAPAGLTKNILGLLFADQPAARLGGDGLGTTEHYD